MYWILFVMGLIAAIAIALVVGGLVTPRAHVVSRTTLLPAAPDDVWHAIHEVARYAEWRHDLEDVDVVDPGPPQLQWREMSTRRALTFGVTRDEPPHRFAARILDEDLPFTGEWTWHVRADGTGTRVTITERGEIGNPVARFIGAHFIGHAKSLDRYLLELARHHASPNPTITDATPV